MTDLEDNKFLDMMGGICGIKAQVILNKKLQILPINNYPNFLLLLLNFTTPSTAKLSGEIASLYQDKKCVELFTSGGSESVETAIKMGKKIPTS